VKLAQRFVCPLARLARAAAKLLALARRARVGVRETGIAGFIFRDDILAVPVKLSS